jgi:hypothetical protein
MANNLGSLVVSLGLDAAEFTRGMSKSEYQAKQTTDKIKSEFGSLLKFVGGLGISALFIQSIRSAADYADSMGKLAARAGTTAEAVSALGYAAKLSDVDNNTLARGLRELGNEAAEGGKKLSAIGVSLTDAAGKAKTSEALFSDVADVIVSIEDPAKRAAVAAKIFGDRIGPELLPLLISGRSGIKDMTDEAGKFGRVISDEAAAKAAQFNDNLTRLSEKSTGLAQVLAGPLIESLANTSSYFIKVANDVGVARAALITFGAAVARTLGLDDVGGLQSQAKANQNALNLTVKQIENFQRLADRGVDGAAKRVAALREQYNQLQRSGAQVSQNLKSTASDIESQFKPVQGTPLERPDVSSLLGGTPTTPKTIKTKRGLTAAQKEAAQAEKDYQALLSSYAEAEDQNRQALFTKRLEDERRAEQAHADWLKSMDDDAAEYRQKLYADRLEAQDKALAKSIEDAAKAAEDQAKRLGDAFSSTFDSAFREGQSFGDLLKKLAYDAINIQFLTPAAQKAGSALGSIFSGIFGGARAAGGAVTAGTTYLVGEKGPELWTAPANGNIIPNNALGGMGGSSFTFAPVIDARGSDAGVQARIDASLRQAEARFRATIVPTVMAAANRGGSAARALGRA